MKLKKGKVLVVFSGGIDSTTLCYYLKAKGYKVSTVTFDYGQKHRKEIEAAKTLSKRLDIPHILIDISTLQKPLKSALTTEKIAIPEGSYISKTMKSTVVPNRNMIMLAIAAGIASSQGIKKLAFAVHTGDHFIYPDCRPEFIKAMRHALCAGLGDWKFELLAPFLEIDKTDIVAIGVALKVPYKETWSCYKGGEKHCGRCGTCQERRKAFILAGVKDLTEYEN